MKKNIFLLCVMFFVTLFIPGTSQAQVTQQSLCVRIDYNLAYTMRDTGNGKVKVKDLQRFLVNKKYLGDEPTGFFGKATQKAIKQFQKEHGIPPTGLVGILTRAKIHEISCGSSTSTPQTTILIPITSPHLGDTWRIGEARNITWHQSNIYLPAVEISLESRSSTSTTQSFVIAASAPNYGSFVWTVGKTQSGNVVVNPGNYSIRICEGSGNARACGVSDIFVIAAATSTQQNPIMYSVSTNKSTYGQFDDIHIIVTAKNTTALPQTLTFSSGCQANYKIGNFDYMQDRACTMIYSILNLPAFESRSWYFIHSLAAHRLTAGNYALEGSILGSGSATTSVTISGM